MNCCFQEPATERSLVTATYRLQGGGGETCILLTVDALLDISYVTKLNERAVSCHFYLYCTRYISRYHTKNKICTLVKI